jgi:spectinomycin phosphotransferase
MLEKPDIPDALILACLQDNYGMQVVQCTFLPLGADQGSAVYRVISSDGTDYFLKLRKGFNEIVVTVPLFLKSHGMDAILAPLANKAKQYWTDFGAYTIIVYPFVRGRNGFDVELADRHKRSLGEALRKIHSAKIPPELESAIPRENYSSEWRERLTDLQRQAENTVFDEPVAAKLAAFMKTRRNEIRHLVGRTEELASELSARAMEFVLCHTDIHGGNILIRADGQPPMLYIVDWDNPLLAPKERDLMFVGGGIDTLWKSKQDESVFYEGYGKENIDFTAMAYYRCERVIEDLVAYGEQLLFSDEGGADREQAYRWFTSNFEPGSTIEIAWNTDKRSKIDPESGSSAIGRPTG